jgi:hypothetical protein
MQIEQTKWTSLQGWEPHLPGKLGTQAQLVLLFGGTSVLSAGSYRDDLKHAYPQAQILGCSTAGEICDTQVTDDAIVATAIEFERTQVRGNCIHLEPGESSVEAGERLGKALDTDGLVHVFVLSDGLHVNGSDLVRGLLQYLPARVTVTGGLSGDGARFQETLVVWHGVPESKTIAAIGLYGDRLKVGYGSSGGWKPFGPQRKITRSQGNVLYELDGQSALELYKKYLGDRATELPASGLLFPLSLHPKEVGEPLVRTILSVNEDEQSLTFAGDIPEGTNAQLMRASFDNLIDGAMSAAETSYRAIGDIEPDLAILISCVGRKLVLKQRIEEEVEGVREILGPQPVLTGFYSYGEISPFIPGAACELHNQTMTITTFLES